MALFALMALQSYQKAWNFLLGEEGSQEVLREAALLNIKVIRKEERLKTFCSRFRKNS